MSVWSFNARARAELIQMTPESLARCRDYAEQAVALDPRNSESYAIIAEGHCLEALYAWNRPPAETLELVISAAQKAVSLDRKNEGALCSLGFGLVLLRRHAEAASMLQRALQLNPNSSIAMSILGIVLVWDRRREEGVELIRQSLRLSPRDRQACFNRVHLGVAAFYAGDFEATVAHCEEAHREFPQNPTALRLMAAALGWLGRAEEARQALQALERLVPGVTVTSSRIAVISAYEEDVQEFLEGLRRAGMPE
jgi:Flp pilus assembly protein TadD